MLDCAPRYEGSTLGSRPTAARKIAEALGGAYFPARNISSEAILDKVRLSGTESAEETRVT